jgi:hypothetical protein
MGPTKAAITTCLPFSPFSAKNAVASDRVI